MAAAMRRLALSHYKYHNISAHLVKACAQSTAAELQLSEEPKYPEIKPKTPPGNWSSDIPLYKIWRFYEEGQALLEKRDVRERLEAIAGEKERLMVKTSGFESVPGTLAYKQFITRTRILKGMPDVCTSVNVDSELELVQKQFEQIIKREYDQIVEKSNRHDFAKQNTLKKKVVRTILNQVIATLALKNEHLLRAQVDKDVRLEAAWRCAGFDKEEGPGRLGIGRIDFQFTDEISNQIRTELPLPEFLPLDSEECTSGGYPEIDYMPTCHQQGHLLLRPTTISGHWVGAPCEFTSLCLRILGAEYRQFVAKYHDKPAVMEEAHLQLGLITGFASCAGQAHSQGFNLYHDLTYPVTTQVVLTDGDFVQPFAYQLNTLHMWQEVEANPRTNLMWAGPRVALGEGGEGLATLLRCLLLKPAERGYNLRPNLAPDEAPTNTHKYINHVGEPPIEKPKIGRWQYPRNAVYF